MGYWADLSIRRKNIYAAAIGRLIEKKLAYPCVCTRREAALAASAPHVEDATSIYPGTCRDRFETIEQAKRISGKNPAIRFRVPDGSSDVGDFVIAKSDGTAAYQLAVVIDDAEMNVTQVVRGDDLLDSTPRQILIYPRWEWRKKFRDTRICRWWSEKMDCDWPNGTATHDCRNIVRRACQLASSCVLARWSGVQCDAEISIDDLLERFDIARLPRERIIMTAAQDAWLNGN